MELAVREAEAFGVRKGTWSVQGVLSQRVRGPGDGGAASWREFNPGGGGPGAGKKGKNAAELWVTFRDEIGGAYGGAPAVFVLVGGERVEEVQLE